MGGVQAQLRKMIFSPHLIPKRETEFSRGWGGVLILSSMETCSTCDFPVGVGADPKAV